METALSARADCVAEVAQRYLEHLRLRAELGLYSAESLERARRYVARFAADFGSLPVERCRTHDLERWLLAHPQWKSHHTKNDAVAAILTCFRWAAEDGIHCPLLRRPKSLKLQLRPRQEITEAEYRRLMLAARNPPERRKRPSGPALRVALYFLWRSGARTCEMRSLLWSDFDAELGIIRLSKHKTSGTTGEDRLIGLDGRLLRMLLRLRRWRRANPRTCSCHGHGPHSMQDHIFRNGRGAPWTKGSFARLFRTFATMAGIPMAKSAYSLRHGFVCECLSMGIGERQIADQLGHTSTRYVAWYGRQARQRAEYLRGIAEQRFRKK